ncbi:hypothetical protein NDU88_008242 [Pleurodeles waltl]|uniref:Uncharacterized protein n=1 Tax=Pleurodeles waltl TaxID=8319 RepID=A0AAV7NX71_PLEWA|nr:hypothetical protein NDU88_008242 [Pleurodeles waltl]
MTARPAEPVTGCCRCLPLHLGWKYRGSPGVRQEAQPVRLLPTSRRIAGPRCRLPRGKPQAGQQAPQGRSYIRVTHSKLYYYVLLVFFVCNFIYHRHVPEAKQRFTSEQFQINHSRSKLTVKHGTQDRPWVGQILNLALPQQPWSAKRTSPHRPSIHQRES